MMDGRISSGVPQDSEAGRSRIVERKYKLRTRMLIIVSLTLLLWLVLIGIVAAIAF
ncbi:hypothetical protein [Parasphingorhabdus sp.]|uniref:hypothetical protein n=1 Tax=Parasphingorhabdus sp. TaxID=2709688 RepID=UPI0032635665